MTLPGLGKLNGKATLAISAGTLGTLISGGVAVVKDRMALGEELITRRLMIEDHERRLQSLENPGGHTVMAQQTRIELDAIYKRLDLIEAQLRGRP